MGRNHFKHYNRRKGRRAVQLQRGEILTYRDARDMLDQIKDKVAYRAALVTLYLETGGTKFIGRKWVFNLIERCEAAAIRGDFSKPIMVRQPELGQPVTTSPIYQNPQLEPVDKLAAIVVGHKGEL